MKILLITLALLLLPWSVTMAGSIERLPVGDGNYMQLTPSPLVDNYLNVDEATCDEGSTNNNTTTNGNRDCYTYPVSGGDAVPADSTVDSLVITICVDHAGPVFVKDSLRTMVRYNGAGAADYDHSSKVVVTNAWTTQSQVWPTNPKTSSAWTASEANDADYQIGVLCVNANDRTYVSRVSATWYYSPGAAPASTPQVIMVN